MSSRARGGWTRRAFLRNASLAAAGITLYPACRNEAPATATSGPVRLPIPTEPVSLDFARATGVVERRLLHLLSDSLVHTDTDTNVVPQLAESWAWEDGGRTLRFSLRRGARWHDGTPVTSADVRATFETWSDPEAGLAEYASLFEDVESVETPDPHTFVAHYSRVYAGALVSWNLPVFPAGGTGDARAPIGCGPWRLRRWDAGERLVVEANESYDLGAPTIPSLRFEIIESYSGRFDALRAGEVDVATLLPEIYARVSDDTSFRERFELHSYMQNFIYFVAWRVDRPGTPLADARVRRALAHAMNREGYLETVGHGLGKVGVTSFHPNFEWCFDESIEPWPHDPVRANAMLDEAGWRRGNAGVRVKDGRPLAIELTYPGTSAQTDRIAAFFQRDLQDVGVDFTLRPLEWSVFLTTLRTREYDAIMSGRHLHLDPDPHELWHSSQIDGGNNFSAFADEEIDRLIERGRRELDRGKRREIYGKMQRLLHESEPMTVLFYPESKVAAHRGLEGFEVAPTGYLDVVPGPKAWRWNDASRATAASRSGAAAATTRGERARWWA
jgi:peptide/nickel transport system substrate-binding protein